MSDQKITHYKVPYKIEDGDLVLDDSSREFIKDEPVNVAEGGVMRVSAKIGEENNKEKDLAMSVGIEEGFVTMKYLT